MILRKLHRSERGFTLIELLVICPILMVVIAYTMNYLFAQYGQLIAQQGIVNLQVEAQEITFAMQDDVFFSNAFGNTTNSNLVDTYQPSGGWKADTTPQTLVVSSPALTASHRDPNRTFVYINTYGCSPESTLEKNDILYNNEVYFVSGTNLYKRTLTAPSSLPTCGSNYLSQTCPADHATSSCPQDNLMTDKISSFTVTYYDNTNTVVTNPEQATKVKVSIQLHDVVYAQDIYASSTLTMRRVNQ
ncbi:MAG TPA: prepilin-type N-terminal cleavage/methylation domain-containing protein [Candidatus Saccharimonadales bacterium]|jgi:Tfp pilus assembly protein PilE|nr:prepilin-type N-terminal cleavage/methylation domain-containing protein [Candidatus Saccharimonadales bacterium]